MVVSKFPGLLPSTSSTVQYGMELPSQLSTFKRLVLTLEKVTRYFLLHTFQRPQMLKRIFFNILFVPRKGITRRNLLSLRGTT